MKELVQALINQGIITATDIERMTTLELLLTIIERVNELHGLTKDGLEAVQRLLDKGVQEEVVAQLDEWVQDGTFDTLINQSALKKVNDRIDEIQTQYSYCGSTKFKIEKHLNVFNNKVASQSTIYWCWVIRVDDKIKNPLGKYYMYYSTDHAGASGFISLAYSDDLLSGWKNYGKIFKNGGYETETPSVMWDDNTNKFIMYFHSASSYKGEAQTSYYTTSVDGINFGPSAAKLLNLDMTRLSGDGHNGYFHPFKIGNKYIAYHLLGGGDQPRFAISYSDDGYNWVTDHRQIGYFCLRNNRFMSPNHCTIINKYGIKWLIGINTNFTSGSTSKDAYVGIVPMQDLYTPIGHNIKLFDLDGENETPNIRQVSVYQEDSKLYVYYQCDNNLHCAIIE